MKNILLALPFIFPAVSGFGQGFAPTAQNRDVPNVEVISEDMDQISSTNYALFDITGDHYPDLIDTEDNATDSTWQSGTQRYWKVYSGNGTSFSPAALNWNVPNIEVISEDMDQIAGTNYAVLDIDGDGFPDLIDTEDNATDSTWQNGVQRYWKVYPGNGTSFSATAIIWDVPNVEVLSEDMDEPSGTNYGLLDMNSDGKPDLIDMEDNATDSTWQNGTQRFWKIYLNTGTAFSANAQDWNVPIVEVSSENMDEISALNYAILDFNGDHLPDLIDTEDNNTDSTWQNGAQRYWKVYLSNGSSFATTAVNWNVPDVENLSEDMDQVFGTSYSVIDLDGDGRIDLVDTEDNATDSTWQNGTQRYWKMYTGIAGSFNATAIDWNVPNVEVLSEDMDQIAGISFMVIDMNANGKPDLLDTEDNVTDSTWQNGTQRFWKVYLNTSNVGLVNISAADFVTVFPNPFTDAFTLETSAIGPQTFTLHDATGQLLSKELFTQRITISMAKFAKGIYLYQLHGEDGSFSSGKLIHQ